MKTILSITLGNSYHYKSALNSITGSVLDQVILLVVRVDGLQPDGHCHLKTTIIITLDNSCYINFSSRKGPGSALDQVLLLALRGAGHQPDGLGGLETCATH